MVTTVRTMEPASDVEANSASYGEGLAGTAKKKGMEIVDRGVEVSEAAKKKLAVLVKSASDYRQTIANGPCGLKLYCFGACVASLVLTIMFEIIPLILKPFRLIVSLYPAIFALVGIILEGSTLPCKALDIKKPIEYWCRFLSRVWGRGLFYLSISLLQFAQQSWVGWICGTLLAAAGLMSFIVSIYGSRQLNHVQSKMVAEYGNKGEASVKAAFDAFDKDKTGALSKTELALATETLGAAFTADQMVGMFELLDADDSGMIEYEEFKSWWTNQKSMDYSWM